MMFMSGGGVGVDYSSIRPYGSSLHHTGGIASGPIPLIEMVNAIGASVRQGGERRGAIYASLAWDHPDITQFIAMKQDGQSLKHTNISVRFDSEWQRDISTWNENHNTLAYSTFMSTLHHACHYGDPGFQFDNDDQILRNACTEIISRDDSDSCCLGSINLANIHSVQELAEVTQLAVLFLLCNTMYTHLPTEKVKQVKVQNRRIGLGLMGIGEWFIQRQLPYGSTAGVGINLSGELLQQGSIAQWLQVWQHSSQYAADKWSDLLSINKPVAVRAIAPTGTISIAGGHTTPGIEPVFHTAYRRTYNTLKDQKHSDGYVTQDVIDPVVSKWIEQGYDVHDIDTAYTLSQSVAGIERRLAFQAFVQRYVDNAISSTINLPAYVEGVEEKIAPILLKYLPKLRGVTFYPDGRYEHQPVVPLDINTVLGKNDTVNEVYESCKGDGCGN
jgi:ribonucleoside-diphosphate reductase alpha chain